MGRAGTAEAGRAGEGRWLRVTLPFLELVSGWEDNDTTKVAEEMEGEGQA